MAGAEKGTRGRKGKGDEKGTQLRRPRIFPGGTCFRVINRAVARLTLFEKEADYIAFERVLTQGIRGHSTF